jgi:putative transposase
LTSRCCPACGGVKKVLKPAPKREAVTFLAEGHAVSHRPACGLLELGRSTFYYVSRRKDDRALRMRLRELAAARPRFGCRRLYLLLRREGWWINHKRASHCRVAPALPSAPNQRWSMDFIADTLDDGRRFRALTIVDVFTRECLAIEADFSVPAGRVIAVLNRFAASRGLAKVITVDNGSEFFSREMDSWAYRNDVRLDFIRPGKPVENAHIESFNGRLRHECLNTELFLTLEDARCKLAEWKRDYNKIRPHTSLGDIPPSEFAEQWISDRPSKAEILNQKVVQLVGWGQINRKFSFKMDQRWGAVQAMAGLT